MSARCLGTLAAGFFKTVAGTHHRCGLWEPRAAVGLTGDGRNEDGPKPSLPSFYHARKVVDMTGPKGHDIIVVGTSAGGLETLDELIGQLPIDLAASVFIVQHMAAHNSGEALTRRLSRHKAFDVKLAKDGERLKRGRIYIAPPDNHLLLKTNKVLVRKGARENRSRPAVDPLFRSAAAAHGSRVIGVVLTGNLDDGAAGLIAIKKCGGVTVVQDPKDAAYPGMPQSALDKLRPQSHTQRATLYKPIARTKSPAKRVVNGSSSTLVHVRAR